MEETRKNDFTKGSVAKVILKMALPLAVAQLVNVLYNIVDRIYIGQMPDVGSTALTGLGLAMPIITAVSAFANLCGHGGAPLCSIARGKGDTDEAQKIMGNAFSLLLIFGVAAMALCLAFKKPILYMLGASDATYVYANEYATIYLLGTIFVMITLGMNSFINSQGFARTGMFTVVIGAVMNIVLDPIFIYALDMGVKGAALATVLSQLISAVWVLCFLTGKKAILRLDLKSMRLQAKRVGRILSLGTTGFVMAFTNSIVQAVTNAVLAQYGGDLYIGAMTVINSIREILVLPLRGLTQGAEPVIGYNYGAGAYKRVRASIKFMSLASIGYSTVCWAVVMLLPEPLMRIFNSDPELLAAGVPAARVFFCAVFLMALQFGGQTAFLSLGKAKQAITFSVLRKVIIVVPLTILLPMIPGVGVMGVFASEPASDILGGFACYLTMFFTVYRPLKKLEDKTPA